MRYTSTLILAVVALAAVVIIVIYREDLTGEWKPPEKPPDELPLIEGVEMDDLAAATLEEAGKDGAMQAKAAFVKKDDAWRLSAPVDAPADDYEVRRLLRAAVEGKYRQTIEPGGTGQPSLGDLTLDPPAYRLALKVKAKDPEPERTVTVDVGRKAAVGEGLYVRLADAKQVNLLLSGDLLERARQRVTKFRSRALVDMVRDDVVRVEIAGPKGALRLDRSDENKDRWVLSKPMAARADPDTASELLRKALGIMAADFVDDEAKDLARYGLAKPRLVVTLYKAGEPADEPKTEDEKKTEDNQDEKADQTKPKPEPVKAVVLKFGAWADLKKESVYLAIGDSKAVVGVEDGDFKALNKGITDLRDKHVMALDKADAAEVTLEVPAKLAEAEGDITYALAKTGGQWQVKVKGRPDAKADASAVDDLLKELADLKVLYFAEGSRADVAKGFKPAGSVRVQEAKASAASGFEIGGTGKDVPALVKNIREDWIGRINPKDLEHLRKDWLEMLDKQVLAFEPAKATRLTIRAPDRTLVFKKTGDDWAMTAPVSEEGRGFFATDRLNDLKELKAETFLAATEDFKPYGLEQGELAVTVTLQGEKEGEKPVEKTLHLAHRKDAKIVGRIAGSNLVFEVPMSLLKDMAGEPLAKELVDLFSGDIERLDVRAGKAKVGLLKQDDKWFRADAAGRPDTEADKTKADDVVKAAVDLDAVRWAAYDANDLARFGLDKPAVRVAVSGKEKKVALLISDTEVDAKVAALFDEAPLRYAMVEGGKRVAVVAGEKVKTLIEAASTLGPEKPEPKKEKAEKTGDEKTPK